MFAERISRGLPVFGRPFDVTVRRGDLADWTIRPRKLPGVGDYGRFVAYRETCTLPVRMDISTLDGVETVQLQDNALLNALNREIEGIGIETTWEGFLFAPPTRATLKEPEAILLSSKADKSNKVDFTDFPELEWVLQPFPVTFSGELVTPDGAVKEESLEAETSNPPTVDVATSPCLSKLMR